MSEEILSAISEATANLEDKRTEELVERAISAGLGPTRILDALRKGLEVVGERYASSEYFVSDLIISGQIMKNAMKTLAPTLDEESIVVKGRIVLGSAFGDMHDIGKDIVKTLLISRGYEVHDLGVDVPSKNFVEKAKEVGANVIGISALLSTTVPMSADVVKELEKEGLRSRLKVILGGGAARKEMTQRYGVDAAVVDVTEGLDVIKGWIET